MNCILSLLLLILIHFVWIICAIETIGKSPRFSRVLISRLS
jgi:hypothetical protein